jgi:crotonobetainyl-CoA:carnitine CoA-transferase CaiB-like acyl-CoA transferase
MAGLRPSSWQQRLRAVSHHIDIASDPAASESMTRPSAPEDGPLHGVRVIDLTIMIAGPAAAGLMADWGADVIKVEPPGLGDPQRVFYQFSFNMRSSTPNAGFHVDNKGKRSVVLDLKSEEGKAAMEELLAGADVFVSNLRLRALEKLGLGPEQLHERFPHLVCAYSTGWGSTGPDADKAAYDASAFWSRSGMAMAGTPDAEDTTFGGVGNGDHVTGMSMVMGICAALFNRARGAAGRIVETSLFRTGIYCNGWGVQEALHGKPAGSPAPRAKAGQPTIKAYTCAPDPDGGPDRIFLFGLETDRHWPPTATAMGHPEWLTDTRFSTTRERARHVSPRLAIATTFSA